MFILHIFCRDRSWIHEKSSHDPTQRTTSRLNFFSVNHHNVCRIWGHVLWGKCLIRKDLDPQGDNTILLLLFFIYNIFIYTIIVVIQWQSHCCITMAQESTHAIASISDHGSYALDHRCFPWPKTWPVSVSEDGLRGRWWRFSTFFVRYFEEAEQEKAKSANWWSGWGTRWGPVGPVTVTTWCSWSQRVIPCHKPGSEWDDKWGQCPLITRVVAHLLSGMSHQVWTTVNFMGLEWDKSI